MNIYAPIAEYELAKQLMIHAHAALEMEAVVPERWSAGVDDAKCLLDTAVGRVFADKRTLEACVPMNAEALWQSIVWNFGSDIYLREESPLVHALISICAEQQGVRHEDCAKAIAREYDEVRLGKDL